jgi:hypothetical protein
MAACRAAGVAAALRPQRVGPLQPGQDDERPRGDPGVDPHGRGEVLERLAGAAKQERQPAERPVQ